MKHLFALLLLAAGITPAQDIDLTQVLPPNPSVVIGGRLRNLFDSELLRGAAASQSIGAAEQWLALASKIGFDPLRDIDEVLLAGTGTGKNTNGLVVVRGRFNHAKLTVNANRYK